MARAMLKPEGEQGKRTDLENDLRNAVGEVSGEYVRRARYVFRHDEALAQSVMSGADTLNAAYEAAKAGAVLYPFHPGGGKDFAGLDALRDQGLDVRLDLGNLR